MASGVERSPHSPRSPGRWALWLAALSGTLAIVSAPWALGQPLVAFVFKPLATLALIAYAWPRGRSSPLVRMWVLAGLSLSWVGDVALLWPQQGFLPGLVSFLLAHLCYLMAFTRGPSVARLLMTTPVRTGQGPRWPFLAYAGVAGAVLWALWPGVPAALRAPVVGYLVCLAAMAAQATVVWRRGDHRGAGLAVGGALFVCSDALLATNKFASPLPLASLWILSTYWVAQALIARWLAPPARLDRA